MIRTLLSNRTDGSIARAGLLGCVLLCWMLSGCLGYRIGTNNLYRTDVRTINVPVVRSDIFRAEVGTLLTECIQKEIEKRTPYKVADAATADSVLACRLTTERKQVIGETNTDEPRLLASVITMELSWTDRRGMTLIETRFLPPGEVTYYFSQQRNFVPEAGQSVSIALQTACEELAQHIVDQLEARW